MSVGAKKLLMAKKREYKYTKAIDSYIELIRATIIKTEAEIKEIGLDLETEIVFLKYKIKDKQATLQIDKDGLLYTKSGKLIGVVDKAIYNDIYEYLEIDRLF
jgi:hypothetical protein